MRDTPNKSDKQSDKQSDNFLRLLTLSGFVVFAALLRVVPHLPNFSPVAAMALFAGAYFSRPALGLFAPIAALLFADAIIGFHDQMFSVYGSILLVSFIGLFLRGETSTNRSLPRIGFASVSGSMVFFVVTNFSVWLSGQMYAPTLNGLIECYVAALPFLRNALLGDLFFSGVLFGGWVLLEGMVPRLQKTCEL